MNVNKVGLHVSTKCFWSKPYPKVWRKILEIRIKRTTVIRQDGDVTASCCVSSLPEKPEITMEFLQPVVSGLGHELTKVLKALQVHNLDQPVWTIKQTNGKIFLDVTWTKPKTRAISADEQPRTNHVDHKTLWSARREPSVKSVQSSRQARRTPVLPDNDAPVQKTKRKSPSTRRCDQSRLEKWKSKKELNRFCEPMHHEHHVPPHSAHAAEPVVVYNQAPVIEHVEPQNVTKSEPLTPLQAQELLHLDNNPDCVSDMVAPSLHGYLHGIIAAGSATHNSVAVGQLQAPAAAEPATSQSSQVFEPGNSQTIDDNDDQKLAIASGPALPEALESKLNWKHENVCYNSQCALPEAHVQGGLKKCTRCSEALYCSKECQAQHWNQHRTSCGKTSLPS